jgi:hypothetical protein
MLDCLFAGHLADSVITYVARHTGADLPAVVGAMWRLVDDGKVDYTTGARLVLLPGCTCDFTPEEMEAASVTWHRFECPMRDVS